MIDAKGALGRCDVLFLTFDSLRLDVAQEAFRRGEIPNFARLLPPEGWEARHTPGSFTYAAHQAFFAGFLPTPATPGRHERLFALSFPGSLTSGPRTCLFEAPDIVSGFAAAGYRTLCIGGVGFFNQQTPVARVLPGLFQESFWSPALGVADPQSARNQFALAAEILARSSPDQRVFLFMNLSATHEPTRIHLPGAAEDSPETQRAALRDLDAAFGVFWASARRRPWLHVLCADHGECFGEEGWSGHRVGRPEVWMVPYAEGIHEAEDSEI
ncbi:STM4013/SEN3800 family hydrolase [Neomegalonema perideroedes]|uniref:STM4013/SEN3800 family hydrolase n=1 Tax=Neomegalonema perideroedes TaxID=217219 RepID=UPI00037DD5FF|nr:STM4013/SEN3800 family hydrolase [Neomegalonema perideroedes]